MLIDLFREFDAAADALGPEIDTLGELGVTFESILKVGYVGSALIQKFGGIYAPAPLGDPVVVVPCWLTSPPSIYCAVEDPCLGNLVALDLESPTRWWVRIPDAPTILGSHLLEQGHADDTAVQLFPTPLAWLQAAGQGVCLLDTSEEIHRHHEFLAELHGSESDLLGR